MSGHSKWSTIKHKKGAADAKRGRLFTRLIKEIMTAARMGGGDLTGNPRLRMAVNTAKANNMPADNIDRAIKKGTGELEGVSYDELCYEGYGPGGAAILVEVMTDNKLRTVAEIRHIFSRNGGSIGEAGCVSWMFQKKGYFTFNKEKISEEKLMELALEAGADDVVEQDDVFEVTTNPSSFMAVREAFDELGLEYESAEVTMIPQSTVPLEGKTANQMIRLMEALEDQDDVQNVYSNFDVEESELQENR